MMIGKIWEEYATRARYLSEIAQHYQCRQQCHGCDVPFRKITTNHIHYAIYTESGKPCYLCDDCKTKIQSDD